MLELFKIPPSAEVLSLWNRKADLAAEGERRSQMIAVVAEAFRDEACAARTSAACLIVSDGIMELRDEAIEHLSTVFDPALTVPLDGISAVLLLEALQFLPEVRRRHEAARRFIDEMAATEKMGSREAKEFQQLDGRP